MNKPKAQTLQQKLGFFDEDLKKTKHDELMLWLDQNIERIVNNIFNKPFTLSEIQDIENKVKEKVKSAISFFNNKIESLKKDIEYSKSDEKNIFLPKKSIDEIIKSIDEIKDQINILENYEKNITIPEKPRIKKITKKWELPITTGQQRNIFTIGFIDFYANFRVPEIELSGIYYESDSGNEYYSLRTKELGVNYKPVEKNIFVEVKTEIKSLGELLRQINHYKSYINGDFYVLCPDAKYKNLLLEQGIKFIEYDEI